MKTIRIVLLSIALVAGALTIPPAAASDPKTHKVYVGKYYDGDPSAPYTYTRFLPGTLQVHRGDTIEWHFHRGFNAWHTVSFNLGPHNMDGVTHDEIPGHFRYSDHLMVGTQAPEGNGNVPTSNGEACGRQSYFSEPEQEPCLLERTDQVTSSALIDQLFAVNPTKTTKFVVKIAENAELGDYRYYCLAHVGMEGIIRVVGDAAPLVNMTEDQIRAEVGKDYLEAQAVEAEAMENAYNPETREWTVWVGKDTPSRHIAITAYVPAHVEVRTGEVIRFVAGASEPNTVTFPAESGGSFSDCVGNQCTAPAPYGLGPISQEWGCDPDGHGPLPSEFFGYSFPRFRDRAGRSEVESGCPLMWHRELYIGPLMTGPTKSPGNLVYAGTFHNSGIMYEKHSPDSIRRKPDGTYFLDEFTAKFPAPSAGAIRFICYAHPDQMRGSVIVK
jgi:plastocyanin